MSVEPVPSGHQNLIPYLIVEDVDRQLEFLQTALGATIDHVSRTPDNKIMHASVRVGDSLLMMGGSCEDYEPIATNLYLYVQDADAAYRIALDSGAESLREPVDEFYGDRMAGFRDPCGNTWWVATRQENLSEEELKERLDKMLAEWSKG